MRLMYSILKKFSNKDLLYIRELITGILAKKLSYHGQSKLFWDINGYSRNLHVTVANPSKNDLEIYKNHLVDDRKDKKVLLLGSTPLLRNLLNEIGFRDYVIADFSFSTIESSLHALDKLGLNIDIENEIWLKSNWLDMPLEPNSFDYIVGDMIFTQIEPSKQSFFITKISSLLKQDGNFIARMQICNTNFDSKNPQSIIEEVLSSNDFENTTRQKFILLFRLKDRLRDKQTQTTSPHLITNELLRFHTSDEKRKDMLRSVIKMISGRIDVGLPFITQTREELEQIISQEFSIKTRLNARDYLSEDFPIYVLQKNINKS
ncbi:MAG: class I SAM-dependent methyltransferase [Patescibacteria group bacterium]